MEIRKIYESFAEDLDIPLRDSSEYNLKYNELFRLIKQVSDKELAKKLEDGVQELSEAICIVRGRNKARSAVDNYAAKGLTIGGERDGYNRRAVR